MHPSSLNKDLSTLIAVYLKEVRKGLFKVTPDGDKWMCGWVLPGTENNLLSSSKFVSPREQEKIRSGWNSEDSEPRSRGHLCSHCSLHPTRSLYDHRKVGNQLTSAERKSVRWRAGASEGSVNHGLSGGRHTFDPCCHWRRESALLSQILQQRSLTLPPETGARSYFSRLLQRETAFFVSLLQPRVNKVFFFFLNHNHLLTFTQKS